MLAIFALPNEWVRAQDTGLPSQVRADMLIAQITQALEEQQYTRVLQRMEALRKLEADGVILPARLLFAEAEAARSLRDWSQARASLSEYLKRAERDDPLYSEAIQMYPSMEAAEAAERDARQVAEEKSREAEQEALIKSLVADMIPIPGGKFKMGDLKDRGDDDEQPTRNVVVAPFLLGAHEVTFAQFDAFTDATGRPRLDDKGWGRGGNPVVNVSWDDAVSFITWLSEKTGLFFRLPSESEWEYAARAGKQTDYWWGDAFSTDFANASGVSGRDKWPNTSPVGQFPPNPYGLHDMNGNAREWVQDCWNASYKGAPKDSKPWLQGDCSRRIVRGGAWNLGPPWLRSSNRDWDDQSYRFPDRGFRLARDQ
jgi:formylglycine-generating enzyme required for sulfatase activity